MLPDLRTALVALAIGLGVGAIGSWYAHSKGRQQGKETVQAMWNAERLAVTAARPLGRMMCWPGRRFRDSSMGAPEIEKPALGGRRTVCKFSCVTLNEGVY